jgi:hypothetical protein
MVRSFDFLHEWDHHIVDRGARRGGAVLCIQIETFDQIAVNDGIF